MFFDSIEGLACFFIDHLVDHKFVRGISGSLDCSVKTWNLDTGRL